MLLFPVKFDWKTDAIEYLTYGISGDEISRNVITAI